MMTNQKMSPNKIRSYPSERLNNKKKLQKALFVMKTKKEEPDKIKSYPSVQGQNIKTKEMTHIKGKKKRIRKGI